MLTSAIKRCFYKRKLLGLIGPSSRVRDVFSVDQDRWTGKRSAWPRKPCTIHSRSYSSIPDYGQEFELPPVDDLSFVKPPPLLLCAMFPMKAIFKIKLGLDRDFNIEDFIISSRHAVSIVSNALANADYNAIQELVAHDTLERLKEHISKLSTEQRRLLAVNDSDIAVQFPYDVRVKDVKRDDGTVENNLQVEILYYYYPKLETYDSVNQPGWEIFKKGIMCNYSFQRTFVNNEGGPWIVVSANHFTHFSLMKKLQGKL